MKYALVCTVEDKRLDIDGKNHWVKVFDSEQDAVGYAEELINRVFTDDVSGMDDCSEMTLKDFQDTLESTEYFRVIPVVE